MSNDDIDVEGLLGCENNEGVEYNGVETEQLVVEQGVDPQDSAVEIESNPIYIGKVFADEEEGYKASNTYVLFKGFGVRKSKTTNSRTDWKVIRRRFFCNKEGHKLPDNRQEDEMSYIHDRAAVNVQQE